ncbi:TrmB family transcriptional regulator [Neobacillus mesonae]|nr:TrmB family transcriptional regulator [Neobacillus mesonae]
MEEEIYRSLQKLGYSTYECKAYIGLLKHSPITGYEISKRTGVPRSMIYEVLGKLLDKGAVHTVPSDPVTYAPLPAKELISRTRDEFEQSFQFLESKLTALEGEREVDVIHRIHSDAHVIAEMNTMIRHAEDELWFSIWESEFSYIAEEATKRQEMQLPIYAILFGPDHMQLGFTTHHNYMSPQVAEERMGGRLTIIARDNKEVLIANFSPSSSAWAIKSQDPALVLVAMEYIRHDMMFSELVKEVGSDKAEALWRGHKDLYHVVTGKWADSKARDKK